VCGESARAAARSNGIDLQLPGNAHRQQGARELTRPAQKLRLIIGNAFERSYSLK
jgi:hypothetical protein